MPGNIRGKSNNGAEGENNFSSKAKAVQNGYNNRLL
jgi:hypothetical protein